VGLLLLRAAVGGTAILVAGRCFSSSVDSPVWMWAASLVSLMSGLFLLAGFLTPIAGGLAAIGVTTLALLRVLPPASTLVDEFLSTILVVVMAIAVELLGPGALSIDARLFGRREIIIRAVTRRPQ
jgi:uncharacterized membrane protein YphA (DoxX/SURF4 family)